MVCLIASDSLHREVSVTWMNSSLQILRVRGK